MPSEQFSMLRREPSDAFGVQTVGGEVRIWPGAPNFGSQSTKSLPGSVRPWDELNFC